eukprot:SAG11_NODE_11531_length_754_cov_1.461069_1_plen_136_part_01
MARALAVLALVAAVLPTAPGLRLSFSAPVLASRGDRKPEPAKNACASSDEGASLVLACPPGGVVTKVNFALYGEVNGSCSGALSKGSCGTDISPAVTVACVGQSGCTVHCSHNNKGCTRGIGPTCGCALTAGAAAG